LKKKLKKIQAKIWAKIWAKTGQKLNKNLLKIERFYQTIWNRKRVSKIRESGKFFFEEIVYAKFNIRIKTQGYHSNLNHLVFQNFKGVGGKPNFKNCVSQWNKTWLHQVL
jgi:hypothetical protein